MEILKSKELNLNVSEPIYLNLFGALLSCPKYFKEEFKLEYLKRIEGLDALFDVSSKHKKKFDECPVTDSITDIIELTKTVTINNQVHRSDTKTLIDYAKPQKWYEENFRVTNIVGYSEYQKWYDELYNIDNKKFDEEFLGSLKVYLFDKDFNQIILWHHPYIIPKYVGSFNLITELDYQYGNRVAEINIEFLCSHNKDILIRYLELINNKE